MLLLVLFINLVYNSPNATCTLTFIQPLFVYTVFRSLCSAFSLSYNDTWPHKRQCGFQCLSHRHSGM